MRLSRSKKWREMLRESKPEIDRLKRWDKFYRLNPTLCPHSAVVAHVGRNGRELPGICLTCGKDGITEAMQGDVPEGEPFTVMTSSTAHTITTKASFV